MRLLNSIFVATTVLIAASSAPALDLIVRDLSSTVGTINGNTVTIGSGESGTVTLGIIIDSDLNNAAANEAVQGLGASAFGYDDGSGRVSFNSGVATDEKVLATNCFPGAGCFDGLDNLVLPSPGNLAESEIGINGLRVQILNMATTGAPGEGTGAIDFGIDGDSNTNVSQGDLHAELVFDISGTADGSTVIEIGTGYEGDGIILPDASIIDAVSDQVTITVPEPATIGSALIALASVFGVVAIRRD